MLAQFGRVPSLCCGVGLAVVFSVRMVDEPKQLTIMYIYYLIFNAKNAGFTRFNDFGAKFKA